jgi:hypothetical protein
MLQAMLLAALIAAPLGSAALFVPARLIDRGAGMWSAVRRLTLAYVRRHVDPRPRQTDGAGFPAVRTRHRLAGIKTTTRFVIKAMKPNTLAENVAPWEFRARRTRATE